MSVLAGYVSARLHQRPSLQRKERDTQPAQPAKPLPTPININDYLVLETSVQSVAPLLDPYVRYFPLFYGTTTNNL